MKSRISISRLSANLILALLIGMFISPFVGANTLEIAGGVFTTHFVLDTVAHFSGISLYQGKLMEGLQTEVWIADIMEQPMPDHSFVLASEDLSEYVEHNKLHLAEAGVEPQTFENYFAANSGELPVADIQDTPHEVTLNIYSTEQTQHRDLEEIELQYNKKQSVINRHKKSLEKRLGATATYAWTPSASNAYNKLIQMADNDSVIDVITDIRQFYMDLDMNENLHMVLTPAHWARIKKEDKKLYKELMAEKNKEYADFQVHSYSQTPLFDSTGAKKPFGSLMEAGDKRSSFFWISNETFRCFGESKMYATLGHPGLQADVLSFGQRALVGNKKASNVKYLAAIF